MTGVRFDDKERLARNVFAGPHENPRVVAYEILAYWGAPVWLHDACRFQGCHSGWPDKECRFVSRAAR